MATPGVMVHPDVTGIHAWGILSGLLRLEREGDVRLRYQDLGAVSTQGRVIHLSDGDRHISFDLTDYGSLAPEAEHAHVIFKRSMRSHGNYDGRVTPLGLVAGYPLRANTPGLKWVGTVARTLGVRAALQQVRITVAQRRGKGPMPIELFEAPMRREGPPIVLFQVRAWDPGHGKDSDDREAQNAIRADSIKALRQELGEMFVGGFVPDDFARARYPSLLSTHKSSPAEYARLVRSATVAVSTTGLHGSDPWKLVEYMAAGSAIVSQPLTNRLPPGHNIQDGVVFANNASDIVGAVVGLAEDPTLCGEMGAANRAYFCNHLRSDRVVERCLRMLGILGGDRESTDN